MANELDRLVTDKRAGALLGGLIGLLVGDAVGVPYEFHPPHRLPPLDQIDMVPPAGFARTYPQLPPGTWSDDGAQALCLLASLQECGKFDVHDFADRLVRWLDDGYMAVDSDVFDVGIQTHRALTKLRSGTSPYLSGACGERDNGNGSLMRVLPLALWHQGSDDDALVVDAHLQSLPTHAHPRSMAACAYYCLVARAYLNRDSDPWSWANARLSSIYADWPQLGERALYLRELEALRAFPRTSSVRGSGYVLDTLWSARQAMGKSSFEDIVRAAVSLGNDTDTTACVAGGLAGLRHGFKGIPAQWVDALRGLDGVGETIAGFIADAGQQHHDSDDQ